MFPEDHAITVQNVLNSPAAQYVAGAAYHCYFGDPSAMTALHNQFPDRASSPSRTWPAPESGTSG